MTCLLNGIYFVNLIFFASLTMPSTEPFTKNILNKYGIEMMQLKIQMPIFFFLSFSPGCITVLYLKTDLPGSE